MAETIIMPKLGFDMAEGTLVRWVKQVGEDIKKGDVLAEIETDKATVEVESSATGVVLQHIVDQGTSVPVNAPIAVVGQADEKIEAAAPAKEEPAKKKPEAKAAEKPEATKEAAAPAAIPATSPTTAPALMPADGNVKASPLARKMARERNIDLGRVQGSGPGGRIVRKDLEAASAGGGRVPAGRPAPMAVQISAEDEVIQLSRLRQAIAAADDRIHNERAAFLCDARVQAGRADGDAQADQ